MSTPVTSTQERVDRLKALKMRQDLARRKVMDQVFLIVGLSVMLACLLVLAVLFIDLVKSGWPRLTLDFFTSFASRRAANAGILAAWVGTSLIMLVTAVCAVPVGVAAAVYLEEYAPKNWFTAIIEINVTNLAGVPSIVYGLLALGLFVYQFDLGQSIAAAGFTLALLILPVVIVATREAIRAVPKAIREAAYGLGATRWEVTKDHVLPYSTGGILTGMILGLSRAIGETAPIITIGALSYIAFLPTSPFSGEWPFVSFTWLSEQFTAMPIQMFNWVSRPGDAFKANAAAAGAVLLAMTLLMNGVAIWIRYRFRKKINW
jgi:phosphate transport system permease protein